MLFPKQPSTEKQIAASRANGAKSRGPVTARGKTISSANSLKHGLLGNAIVLDGESSAKFMQLHDALFAEFMPQSPVEVQLVETMVVARWRQMRVWGLEKTAIADKIAGLESDGRETPTPAAEATAEALNALSQQSRWVAQMNAHEFRLDRQYSRAMATLRQHRTWRAAELKSIETNLRDDTK